MCVLLSKKLCIFIVSGLIKTRIRSPKTHDASNYSTVYCVNNNQSKTTFLLWIEDTNIRCAVDIIKILDLSHFCNAPTSTEKNNQSSVFGGVPFLGYWSELVQIFFAETIRWDLPNGKRELRNSNSRFCNIPRALFFRVLGSWFFFYDKGP